MLKNNQWSLKKPLYLKKSDKRYDKMFKQLKKHGFCDSETWCLFSVISQFILPRLKKFKEITNGYPSELSVEKWESILDDMIFAFDWASRADECEIRNSKKTKDSWSRYNKGMKLFGKYFMDLWW